RAPVPPAEPTASAHLRPARRAVVSRRLQCKRTFTYYGGMRVHVLRTGVVEVSRALTMGVGLTRRVKVMRRGVMVGPLPIHAWLVEMADRLVLVDAGETVE